MGKKCMVKALIVLVFAVILCFMGHYFMPDIQTYGETLEDISSTESEMTDTETTVTEMTVELTPITDLSDAFHVILKGATKEFISGYVIDEAFLMWLTATYGEKKVIDIAKCVLDYRMNENNWYEITGSSLHVLWLQYCEDTGFQSYQLSNVFWMECADEKQTVLSFAGDFNLAEGWCTTEYMAQQENGIYDCFSQELLAEMNASDILVMNNEFTYTDSRASLSKKDYTFRAKPQMAELLNIFGTDLVTLANNHVFDYGERGLSDTMEALTTQDIPYVGAGKNVEEASKIAYFVANGRKIAIVSATEIERSVKYTREATETESGVLKTLDYKKFVPIIEKAKASSDDVIVVVHWGTEGTLYPDNSQLKLAEKFVEAGADAIIGGHPHRLQGAGYIKNAPVAYSLGNFWFSTGTLYTTLTQIVISEDGNLQLRYLPCVQKGLTTSLITDTKEKEEFYHYLASISVDIGMDTMGNVYDKDTPVYEGAAIAYDSDTSTTQIRGYIDNEGNAIDIVGNLRQKQKREEEKNE